MQKEINKSYPVSEYGEPFSPCQGYLVISRTWLVLFDPDVEIRVVFDPSVVGQEILSSLQD